MKCAAAMIVLLASPLVSAPPPRLVREIDLRRAVPAIPDFAPTAVLAFSPDEKWLALEIGAFPLEFRSSDRKVDLGASESLLLLPLNGSTAQPVQTSLGLRAAGNPAWSPDSAMVLVEGLEKGPVSPSLGAIAKVQDLKGDELLRRQAPGLLVSKTVDMGQIWDGPLGGIFGFLDSAHLLVRATPLKGMPAAFDTIDLGGKVVDTWKVPKHWAIADISPERGLLAILSEQATKTLVVDYASKKVILSRDNPYSFRYNYQVAEGGRWQFFAESGKTLCSVGSVGTDSHQLDTATECWDVDSGMKIAQFDGFRGGAPAAASSHGSRLVLTHDIAFPHRNEELVFLGGERVVWDFRSGGEIARWDAPQLGYRAPDHVAISSSGRYVAETYGTIIRIYELP